MTPQPQPQKRHTPTVFTESPPEVAASPPVPASDEQPAMVPAAAAEARATAVLLTKVRRVSSILFLPFGRGRRIAPPLRIC